MHALTQEMTTQRLMLLAGYKKLSALNRRQKRMKDACSDPRDDNPEVDAVGRVQEAVGTEPKAEEADAGTDPGDENQEVDGRVQEAVGTELKAEESDAGTDPGDENQGVDGRVQEAVGTELKAEEADAGTDPGDENQEVDGRVQEAVGTELLSIPYSDCDRDSFSDDSVSVGVYVILLDLFGRLFFSGL